MHKIVPGVLVSVLCVVATSCRAGGNGDPTKSTGRSAASPTPPPENGPADNRNAAVARPQATQVETSDEPARGTAQRSPIAAAAPVDEHPAAYPIKWTKRLELSSATDASKELMAEKPDSFVELELSGERIQPATCLEWFELHERGFTPRTSIDEHDDGIVKERCDVLRLIEKARPSRQSHVRDLPWNARLLSVVPAGVTWPVSPEIRARIAAATTAGQSLREFDPKAKVQRSRHPDLLEILQGDRSGTIALQRLLWADLNEDGVEDIVISVLNADTHGPMTMTRLLIATRTSEDGPLQPIEWR